MAKKPRKRHYSCGHKTVATTSTSKMPHLTYSSCHRTECIVKMRKKMENQGKKRHRLAPDWMASA